MYQIGPMLMGVIIMPVIFSVYSIIGVISIFGIWIFAINIFSLCEISVEFVDTHCMHTQEWLKPKSNEIMKREMSTFTFPCVKVIHVRFNLSFDLWHSFVIHVLNHWYLTWHTWLLWLFIHLKSKRLWQNLIYNIALWIDLIECYCIIITESR